MYLVLSFIMKYIYLPLRTILRRTVGGRVTTMWVNRPLQVSQLGQLSLSSFWGR